MSDVGRGEGAEWGEWGWDVIDGLTSAREDDLAVPLLPVHKFWQCKQV